MSPHQRQTQKEGLHPASERWSGDTHPTAPQSKPRPKHSTKKPSQQPPASISSWVMPGQTWGEGNRHHTKKAAGKSRRHSGLDSLQPRTSDAPRAAQAAPQHFSPPHQPRGHPPTHQPHTHSYTLHDCTDAFSVQFQVLLSEPNERPNRQDSRPATHQPHQPPSPRDQRHTGPPPHRTPAQTQTETGGGEGRGGGNPARTPPDTPNSPSSRRVWLVGMTSGAPLM